MQQHRHRLWPEGKDGPVKTIHRRHLQPCPANWTVAVSGAQDESGRASGGLQQGPSIPLGWPVGWGGAPAPWIPEVGEPQGDLQGVDLGGGAGNGCCGGGPTSCRAAPVLAGKPGGEDNSV